MKSWAGWTEDHVRRYCEQLREKNGTKMAAKLCGVSTPTFEKFLQGKKITLGALVRIAERVP